MTYSPLTISGFKAGLTQQREEFLLPDDAYPVLENAYVWREQLVQKSGVQLLGRLQRNIVNNLGLGNTNDSSISFTTTFADILTTLGFTETNAEIVPGSVVITVTGSAAGTLTDQGNGFFVGTGFLKGGTTPVTSTINYVTGALTIVVTQTGRAPSPISITFSYAPGLPVMGARTKEEQSSATDISIFFDQVYAYIFDETVLAFEEWIPGITWSGTDYQFFWTTNYWVGVGNTKIFWATNGSGANGAAADPIRYTNGTAWIDFAPQIDAATPNPNLLNQCLCLLPFRGRLLAFNTYEGTSLASSLNYSNRIRWAAIGTPFTGPDSVIVFGVQNPNAWRDDIRGQGGFLDIPTSEDIISVGFVRDNLVIYCENSTWQLRYTGRSIAPFQIEKVNSELGTLGTFSSVQFDTSLVGFGDKGIVECDSYQSTLIDIKIPDLVFFYQHENHGPTRVHGIRNFVKRLAYWTFPSATNDRTYPNQRLVYNYENDSWALFTDSLTVLGTYQVQSSRTWLNTDLSWIECDFTWLDTPDATPVIVGGNQQGFVLQLDQTIGNDISLSITGITSNGSDPTTITSPNYNLDDGTVIEIYDIPAGTPYSNLNFANTLPFNNVFSIIRDPNDPQNKFQLYVYNPTTDKFDLNQVDASQVYVGGGKIAVRDNFFIQSKKFNYVDQGQSIQMGYIDMLMSSSGDVPSITSGAISMNVYLDYNTTPLSASNTSPENEINQEPPGVPNTFFNTIVPTTQNAQNNKGGTKFWQRIYCPTRANFLTVEFTFSNAQMASTAADTAMQIDSMVLWQRKAGRMTQS